MSCLVTTKEIKDLTKALVGETIDSTKALIEVWQQKYAKDANGIVDIEKMPSLAELKAFRIKQRGGKLYNWDRQSDNSFEVSTKGNAIGREFSAKVAKFNKGTIINGVDVGGETIETVYQTLMKHGKLEKGNDKKTGKPTVKELNPNDENLTISELEDLSYEVAYLPLWREWVKQNPDKIKLLESNIGNKVLTDTFASTRVSQARAIAQILSERSMAMNRTPVIVLQKSVIGTQNLTRDFAASKPRTLFLFTDNTDRTSGSTPINPNSWYAKKYGEKLSYPKVTQAVIRGLDNARPISTQKHYDRSKSVEENRWNDEDFEEFKKIIDDEFNDILEAWKSGEYDRIVLPNFNGKISQLNKERTPKLWGYLQNKIKELTGVKEDSQAKINRFESDLGNYNIATSEDLEGMFQKMSYQKVRDRSTLILRNFSTKVDYLLEKEKKILDNRIANSDDAEEKKALLKEKDILTRFDIIQRYTPAGIYNLIKEDFQKELNTEDKYKIKSLLGNRQLTKELLEKLKSQVDYINQEFKLILDNYKSLCEIASLSLSVTEGIRIDTGYKTVEKLEETNNDDTDTSEKDEVGAESSQEEATKDGWMVNCRQVSSHESLAQEVRKIIRSIIKVDYAGKPEKDDLGIQRYLDAEFVHAVLIDKLKDMTSDEDMFPILESLKAQYPWISQIIGKLNKDQRLQSMFYHNFRKDFLNYRKMKTSTSYDGSTQFKTIPLNKPEGIYYLLDSWRDNYESRSILDADSVYDMKGSVLKDKAKIGKNIVDKLINKYNTLSSEDQLNVVNDEDDFKNITKALKMLGISIDENNLSHALSKAVKGKETNVMKLLTSLATIYKGIADGSVEKESAEKGKENYDLINTFGTQFNNIALMVAKVTDNAIESSIRENGKSYYSHTNPSYLLKTIKKLKNVLGDESKFQKYIEDEFGKYEWFKKGGKWLNTWVEKLATDPKARESLDHHILLNYNDKEYGEWDDLDYTLVLLNQFNSEPKESGLAWYAVPTLSDSQSSEFIRFERVRTGDELDENGNKLKYDNIIINRLKNLVTQEYNRIQTVRKRAEKINSGDKSIKPIANFDMVYKNGELVNVGAAEFKFLPSLNDGYFLSTMEKLIQEEDYEELDTLMEEYLKEILERKFEEAMFEWHKMGLFDSVENKNKLKYFNRENQEQRNKRLVNKIKNVYTNILHEEPNTPIIKQLLNQEYINKEKYDILREDIYGKLLQVTTKEEADNIYDSLEYINPAREDMREYFYNSFFATSQIIELTVTDLGQYASLEDFTKRYKEVHAPSLRMNTSSKYGKKKERTIYIKDPRVQSTILEEIEKVLKQNPNLSKIDRDFILTEYKKVNVTDGQAYRSLSSYRSVLDMAGKWTDAMESAYEKIQNGQWSIEDYNTIWQPIKPYLYSQVAVDSGVGDGMLKQGVQHKNSEFLLLADTILGGKLANSEKLRAINAFMNNRNIDVVQFDSVVKVGNQGAIDLSDVESYDDVLKALEDAIGPDSNENDNVLHTVPYEDYGFQSEVPEHIIDTEQLFGTQIRKLIAADMEDSVTINGTTMTKAEWWQHYNKLLTENIFETFRQVDKIFEDPKQIERVIQEEASRNNKYNQDIRRACTLDDNGQFQIPLYDPVQTNMVQQLLNSIIKNRITKQKIKGGSLVQVSAYGLTDELKIIFKDKEGKILNYEEYKKIKGNETHSEWLYKEWAKKALEEGEISIAYFECYMPAYSKEFYEPLLSKDGHTLDVTKLDDKLRKLIGYRIPTEDKYSMSPLYIKGFLPQQNGSTIMMPEEITTITGSDFDIDKMYVMLPEFKINYDITKAWEDFYNDPANEDIVNEINTNYESHFRNYVESQEEDYDSLDDDILDSYQKEFDKVLKNSGAKNYHFSQEARNRFKTWFKTRKENYINKNKPFVKIEYNNSKSESQNSRKQRNNRLIDMMWGVLTDKNTSHKMLKPGGFTEHKRVSRMVSLLAELDEPAMFRILKEADKKVNNSEEAYNAFLELDPDTFENLWSQYKPKLDPLSPRTQVKIHQNLMTGAALIGGYANQNANHAMLQWVKDIRLSDMAAFTLNGKKLTKLDAILNSDGQYISNVIAGYLAASVDNAKDPVLGALNQNSFTIGTTMLLARLGYSVNTIGLFLNQPIVKDITSYYMLNRNKGISIQEAIETVVDKYKVRNSHVNPSNSFTPFYKMEMKDAQLAYNIMLEKRASQFDDMSSITEQNSDVMDFYNNQISVGYLFKHILRSADLLEDIVSIGRADTQNGGAGPTIADTFKKIMKAEKVINKLNGKSTLITGLGNLINPFVKEELIDGDTETLNRIVDNSPIPMLQAFYTYGVAGSYRLLGKYFPQFKDSFDEIFQGYEDENGNYVRGLNDISKYGELDIKTMNDVYDNLLAYILSKNSFFGLDANASNGLKSARDKRDLFINSFPEYFAKFRSENKELENNEFVKRIAFIKANKSNPTDILVFKNVGHLSKQQKDRFTNEWISLITSSDEKVAMLGSYLFLYSFYRNGLGFGPSTFSHLAPLSLRQIIPDYIKDLRDIMTSEDSYKEFIDQYVLNHLDNRRLVPMVSDGHSIEFKKGNDILDNIIIPLSNEMSSANKSAVRDIEETKEGDLLVDYYSYLAFRNGGNTIYYKYIGRDGDNLNYERVEPLGYKNQFVEYEYGSDVSEMKSVIAVNDKFYTLQKDLELKQQYEGSSVQENSYFESLESDEPNTDNHSVEGLSNEEIKRIQQEEASRKAFGKQGYTLHPNAIGIIDSNGSESVFIPISEADKTEVVKDDENDDVCF